MKDETKYNKSHALDPTAHRAIKEADKMPYKIKGFIYAMKGQAEALGLRIENRIIIRDLETGHKWD